MKTPRFRPVEETVYGLYVWKLPDGRILADNDDNLLNVPAKKHDLRQIAKLRAAAKYFGFEEGEPVFLSGRRRVTDSEFAEQQDRLHEGLTPDKYDVGALLDEVRSKRAAENG
jgi:hypothetical protein